MTKYFKIKDWLFIFFALAAIHIANAQEKPMVVCSASMFADMTENIVGDLAEIRTIVPIGGDPHLYEPVPSDAQLVARADLILMNGLTFEGWIEELVKNSGAKATTKIITEGIDYIASEAYSEAPDPHAWMNPRFGLIYVKNITKAIVELMPQHKTQIESNSTKYLDEILKMDAYIQGRIQSIPEKTRVLVTSHDAFAYFGDRYHIKLEPIMGISTEADVKTSDVVRVTNSIKNLGVPAIFIESTINPKLLQQIADETGVVIGGELFADSLGEKESKAGSYLGMLKHNADVITNALLNKSVSTTKIDHDSGAGSSGLVYGLIAALLLLSFLFFIFKMNR